MNNHQQPSRRRFLGQMAAIGGAGLLGGGFFTGTSRAADKARSAVERPGIGGIGLRYQGSVVLDKARAHGDVVALCDVDEEILAKAKSDFGAKLPTYENYQDLLARDDIDIITIGTPDHWHTKMVIDAARAGKHIYCEKPLTLTIDEGKILRDVVNETGAIVQVGSWQRSDSRFRLAVELVRAGRIGKLERVDIILGKNKTGGPFATKAVPKHFNWNLWQGQTPDVPYIPERSHYTFRWWYEYSGGQMTDWGAHHLDIGQWAIGESPIRIEGKARYPDVKNGYNVALDYEANYTYPSGVVMTVGDTGRNGVLFTGTEGRIFVNRGTVDGVAVDELASNALPREDFQLYDFDNLDRPERAGKLDAIVNHMGNFFDCIEKGKTPISDIESQHRSVSTCHLGNIAMRLGRPLQWDPEQEVFVDDAEANTHLKRQQRPGFEIA